jgi:hypothetical protein
MTEFIEESQAKLSSDNAYKFERVFPICTLLEGRNGVVEDADNFKFGKGMIAYFCT